MAFQSGFDILANDSVTFAQWLSSHNQVLNEFRNSVMSANAGSYAFTDGDARLNGKFAANTLSVIDGPGLPGGLSGGKHVLDSGSGEVVDIVSANLYIVSNTVITEDADWLDIRKDLAVTGNVVVGANTDNVNFFSQKLVVNGAILTTDTAEDNGTLYFGNTDNSITTIANGNMEIRTTSTLEIVTDTEERIRIDKISGNVSIGASQDAHHTVQIHANTDTPAIHLTTDTTGKDAGDGSLIALSNTDDSLLISNREDSYIAIDTNDTERMRVAANGFVGIGTNTPHNITHIHNQLSNSAIQLTNGLTGNTATDGTLVSVSNTDNSLLISNREDSFIAFGTNNLERSRIAANGNIGIDITTPQEKLHANGNIHVSGGDRTIYNRSNNFLALGTNNLERARISAGGNVSIGTVETTQKLTVNGSILATNNTFGATIFLGNTNNSIVKTPGGNTTIRTTHNMRLFTDAKERIRVATNGDIFFYNTNGTTQKLKWDATANSLGVNTSPGTGLSLHVSGNTQTTNLVVLQQTTSDDVVINDELRGNNTTGSTNGAILFVTTNAEFTADQVLIRNDLIVDRDGSIGQDLIVGRDGSIGQDLIVGCDGSIGKDLTVTFDGSIGRDLTVTANTSTGNLNITNFVLSNLVPNTSISYNVGNTSNRWATVFSRDANLSRDLTVTRNTSTANLEVTNFVYSSLTPNTNITYNIGSATNRWATVFSQDANLSRNLTVTSNTSTGNLAVTQSVLSNLVPNTNIVYDVGNTTNRWATVFSQDANLSRDLTVTRNTSTANLAVTSFVYSSLTPNTNVTHNVGSSTNRWATVFSRDANLSRNLTVTSNTSTGNLAVTSFVYSSLTPNTNVTHNVGSTTNRWATVFSHDADLSNDLTVTRNTSTANLAVTSFVYSSLTPNAGNTHNVGTSTNRWATLFSRDANLSRDLIVTRDGSIGRNLTVSNNTDVNNNLTVANTINGFQVVGVKATSTTSSTVIIDSFPVARTKGFKYIVHGQNALANSAYAVEIVGAHNNTNVFFTRYGELKNSFAGELSLRISGGNVLLEAKCELASSANVHSFNIIRFETR